MEVTDARHIPPPDPAAFWDFKMSQSRVLAAPSPLVILTLNQTTPDAAEFTMTLDGKKRLTEWLYLDSPVIAFRMPNDIEPAVTLTLRELRDGKAFLQVTAHPNLRQMKRSALEQ